jgi:hypothetical protein
MYRSTMLSLTRGRPIAKICGGKLDGELIFLDTTEEPCCSKCGGCCLKHKKPCCKNCCKMGEIGKKIMIDDGKLTPVPNDSGRETPYIAGQSGSGKSTLTAEYAGNFKKMYKDGDIFLFSRLDEDPSLDKIKPTRIKIDDSLVHDPIDITKEIQDGSLIIFDDIDTIQDKKQRDAVYKLLNDVLEIGRHINCYCIVTNHLINPSDRKFGRCILNECSSISFFPKSGNAHQISYVLKNYLGFSTKQIKKVMKLPSRWVTVFKNYPTCVLYEQGCFIP